jgi:hypothetical protein
MPMLSLGFFNLGDLFILRGGVGMGKVMPDYNRYKRDNTQIVPSLLRKE